MILRMVGSRFTQSTRTKRSTRLRDGFAKCLRDGNSVKTETLSESRKLRQRLKRVTLKYWVMSGVVVPWLHASASQAADVVDSAVSGGLLGMEAETFDVGAVLLGDVALLVMAPLVIYAALKMIWEERFEDPNDTDIPSSIDEGLSLEPDLRSNLKDAFLQELATKAAKNISRAAQDASQSCLFDAEFHELVMKSEGADVNPKWIQDVLSKQRSISEPELEQMSTELMRKTGDLTDEEICTLLSRRIAERAAVKELQMMTEELIKRRRS